MLGHFTKWGQAHLEKRELPNLGRMSWDSEFINSFTKYLFLLEGCQTLRTHICLPFPVHDRHY